MLDSSSVRLFSEVHVSLQVHPQPTQTATASAWVEKIGIRAVHKSVRADIKESVVKLERVLAAVDGIEGEEVHTIRTALERAKKALQAPVIESQIRDCEQFLVRLVRVSSLL